MDERPGHRILSGSDGLMALLSEVDSVAGSLPRRIDADPEHVERGLARVVLTVVDLLRELMERQAMRRVESGSLTEEEVERLGRAFMKLEERMGELKKEFGLEEEDLRLELATFEELL